MGLWVFTRTFMISCPLSPHSMNLIQYVITLRVIYTAPPAVLQPQFRFSYPGPGSHVVSTCESALGSQGSLHSPVFPVSGAAVCLVSPALLQIQEALLLFQSVVGVKGWLPRSLHAEPQTSVSARSVGRDCRGFFWFTIVICVYLVFPSKLYTLKEKSCRIIKH